MASLCYAGRTTLKLAARAVGNPPLSALRSFLQAHSELVPESGGMRKSLTTVFVTVCNHNVRLQPRRAKLGADSTDLT